MAGGSEGCVGWAAAQHPQCFGAMGLISTGRIAALGTTLASPAQKQLQGWAWEGQAGQPGREQISHSAPLLLLFFSSLTT